jgi:hypothetical protein
MWVKTAETVLMPADQGEVRVNALFEGRLYTINEGRWCFATKATPLKRSRLVLSSAEV